MASTANKGPATAPAINRIRVDTGDVRGWSIEVAADALDVADMTTPSIGEWLPLHPRAAGRFDTKSV